MTAGGFRTVLFDLDGTLVDSSGLILESFRHTMRVHRDEVPPDSAWLESMGRPLAVQLREFAEDEEQAAAMRATYREHQRRNHDALLARFSGVERTLRQLRAGGTRLGIVTSRERAGTGLSLRAAGLPETWFETVITADDVREPKPAPEPLRRALDSLGEEPRRALFVGDSVHDLEAGRAADVSTAAALWGPYGRERLAPAEPDYWVERVTDVPRLLDGRRGRDRVGS